MADPGLHENGDPCPACELRREELQAQGAMNQSVACNNCGGTGRIARTDCQIVQASAGWAREHYWPERERRWAEQNRRKTA